MNSLEVNLNSKAKPYPKVNLNSKAKPFISKFPEEAILRLKPEH